MTLIEHYSKHMPIEHKAIQWLTSFCETEPWVQLRSSKNTTDECEIPLLNVELIVESVSNRRYELNIYAGIGEQRIVQLFQPSLRGKINLESQLDEQDSCFDKERYWCYLCLEVEDEHEFLPFGDHLITLALALRDDVNTAKKIPLLDMFLAHDEAEHVWIEGYYISGPETGIYDREDEKLIPLGIRTLCHKFSCLEDELACSSFGEDERYKIIEEQMRTATVEIRKNKLGSLYS